MNLIIVSSHVAMALAKSCIGWIWSRNSTKIWTLASCLMTVYVQEGLPADWKCLKGTSTYQAIVSWRCLCHTDMKLTQILTLPHYSSNAALRFHWLLWSKPKDLDLCRQTFFARVEGLGMRLSATKEAHRCTIQQRNHSLTVQVECCAKYVH